MKRDISKVAMLEIDVGMGLAQWFGEKFNRCRDKQARGGQIGVRLGEAAPVEAAISGHWLVMTHLGERGWTAPKTAL